MALDLGELSGQVTFDYTPLQRALQMARREIDQFSQTAWDSMPIAARQAASQAAQQVDQQLQGAEATADDHGEGIADKFASGLKKGAAGVIAAAAAVGAAAGAGIVEAASREVNTDRLGAVLGGGEKQMARYGETAGRIYANNFGDSFEDVTTAVEAVATTVGGIGRGKGLQDLTEQALNFTDVLGLELPRSVQVAEQLVKTGLVDNVSQGFDLMLAGARRVPLALREDLIDALDEYGPFFSAMGLTGEQAMTALVNGADQGMYGLDKTGDAVKEFTIRATDMSTSTRDAYKAIGIDTGRVTSLLLAGGDDANVAMDAIVDGLLKIEKPGKRANAAIALFGTPLEDIGVHKIPAFLRSLSAGEESLGKWEGANERAGKALNDNAARDFGAWKRTVETAFLDFIETELMPTVDDLAQSLADNAGPAVEQFGEVWEDIRPIVEGFLDWYTDEFLPTAIDAWGDIAGAVSQFFDDISSELDEHPELKEAGEKLAEGFGWLVEHILPAVADWMEFYLPIITEEVGLALDAVEQLAIGFTYVAQYGAEAAMIVLDAFAWAFEGILNFANETFGWIFDLLNMDNPIDDALTAFGTFRRGAEEDLETISDAAQAMRDSLQEEITPEVDTGPALARIGELIAAAQGLSAAVNPDRPGGGRGNSTGPTDLETLLGGAPSKPRKVPNPGSKQRSPKQLDEDDEDSGVAPSGRRAGRGNDGRPVAAVYVENLVAHDYDDFRRETTKLEHQASDGLGVRRTG